MTHAKDGTHLKDRRITKTVDFDTDHVMASSDDVTLVVMIIMSMLLMIITVALLQSIDSSFIGGMVDGLEA